MLGCSEAKVDMFGRQLLGKRFGGSANGRHIDSRDNGPGMFEDRVAGSLVMRSAGVVEGEGEWSLVVHQVR